MIFNKHSNLEGQHAFLSASKYHWVNYDDEKIDRAYIAALAARRGTELHLFAHNAIRLGIKLPATRKTMHLYVNDAIGYRMSSEVVLFYSDNCYGTPDTISFRKNKLRIHDLKTGLTQTSERQLEVYAALFCLEYGFKPHAIEMEFRIYQNDEVRVYDPDPDVIAHIMDRIIISDKRINAIRMEVES
jgi:hypothetical protein